MKKVINYGKIDKSAKAVLFVAFVVLIVELWLMNIKAEALATSLIATTPWLMKFCNEFYKIEKARAEHMVLIRKITRCGNTFDFEFCNDYEVDFKNYNEFEIRIKYLCKEQEIVAKKHFNIYSIKRNCVFNLPMYIYNLSANEFLIWNIVEKNEFNKGKTRHIFNYKVYNVGNEWHCMLIDEKHEYFKHNRKERKAFSLKRHKTNGGER